MADRPQPSARPSPEEPPGSVDVLPDDIGVRAGGHVEVDLDAPIPVPRRVAMVGSDLDGTLLGPTLEVGPRSLAAIPRLAGAGVEFVYVTGRPPRWLRPIIAQTGHAGMAVCANGALVVDLAEERLLRRTAMAHDLAARRSRCGCASSSRGSRSPSSASSRVLTMLATSTSSRSSASSPRTTRRGRGCPGWRAATSST